MKAFSTNTAIEEDIKTAPASPSGIISIDALKVQSTWEPRHLSDSTVHATNVTIYDPPITVAMLKELDSDTLTASVQIRHDLVLEPMLRLRPNSQRRTSQVFQSVYRQYWTAMEQELQQFATNRETPKRLLRCLEEIKKLIINCYPNSSAVIESMTEVFDTDLLEHQIINGTLTLGPFMEEIARILKQNCAPRRDPLVDHLVEMANNGKYVLMIREFFEILELMKLDLANYHLLSLKSTPVEVITKMERDYFKLEMIKGNKSLESVRSWLPTDGSTITFDHFKQQFAMLMIDKKTDIPETWYLDASRINTYRNEVQLLTISASVLAGIKQICGKSVGQESTAELKSRIMVLVNSPKTKVKDLCENLSIVLARCNVDATLIANCETIINRLIRPDSPLFQTVQERVQKVICDGILDPSTLPDNILDKKLSNWTSELTELVAKMNKMHIHHWTVFHEIYQTLSQD